MIDSTQSGPRNGDSTPPAPFRQKAPNTIEVKKGGGMIAVFGLPFLLAGMCMDLAVIGVLPANTESGEHVSPLLLGLMGLVFAAVGGILVFGRQWMVLDLSRRSISRQFGLIVPMRTQDRLLSEFNAVVISYDPGGSDSAEKYPVKLRASIGKDVVIVSPLQFAESRQIAEYLARTLHLPLSDTTTDHGTTVEPERAGQSLRNRLDSAGLPGSPLRPPIMRCEVEVSPGATKIVIPSGGPRTIGYIGALLPFAVILVALPMVARFLTRTEVPPGIRLAGILTFVFGLPAIFAGIRFLVAAKRRTTTVTASPSGLVIVQPQGRRMRATAISAEDLLDVDSITLDGVIATVRQSMNEAKVESPKAELILAKLKRFVPNTGIVVKSRTGVTIIGEGLSTNELHYLVWLLKKALIG